MKYLADSHNFGKSVTIQNGLVNKPRNIYWEMIFLNENSPLRILINRYSKIAGVVSPFEVAPNLKIFLSDFKSGIIEQLNVKKVDRCITQIEAQSIGAMSALCYWLGIGDLHHENVVVGLDDNGKLICFPIDIETLFEKMTHVDQTLLFPSEKVSVSQCGLSSILSLIGQKNEKLAVGFIKEFVKMINLLNEISEKVLQEFLKDHNIHKYPIRMILRDTEAYYKAMYSENEKKHLDVSEIFQISRNDIPYFFRYLNTDSVFYFLKDNMDKTNVIVDREQFNLMSSIILTSSKQQDFLKTNTVFLSITYLARIFGLPSSGLSLNKTSLYLNNKTLHFRLNNLNILFYETV
ncbi:MAG: hypothetical protein ACK41T_05000 [Pseudobdellovibrio sp.]